MTQILSIGTGTLQPDTAWFTITRTGIKGRTGRLNYVRHMWDINGFVKGKNAAEVDANCEGLIGLVKEGIDLRFSLGSDMGLLSSNCTEGTHIAKFEWLRGYDGVRGNGAEGVLRRTFHLVVYGDIAQSSDTDIVEWHETITSVGNGGAHVVPVPSLAGVVQAQVVHNYSPIWILQSGFAVGLIGYPTPATPIFQAYSGAYFPQDGVSYSRLTPQRYGINLNTHFPVRWNHKCWVASGFGNTLPIPTLF